MSQVKHLILAKSYDKKNRQVSQAFNSYQKSDPLQKHFAVLAGMPEKQKLHAEILCLKRAGDKQVHTLTIERYGKDGRMLLARPCAICTLAIKAFGVGRIIYTSEDGMIEEFI
jgi:tRNA(Arg) A34 adenosine deaminase TadA